MGTMDVLWVLFLFSNGTPVLAMNVTFSGDLLNVSLPADYESYPLAYVDGELVPYIMRNGTVTVPVFGPANVSIRYVPKVTVSGGFASIEVGKGRYLMYVESGVLLLDVPHNVTGYRFKDGVLTVMFIGPARVNYTILLNGTAQEQAVNAASTVNASEDAPEPPPIHEAPPQDVSPQPSVDGGNTVPKGDGVPPMSPSPTGPSTGYLLAVAVAVASAGMAVAIVRRRRSSGTKLRGVEQKIVEYLSRVGDDYESNIAKIIGEPRATVWRAVRRLEELGVVEVEKRGGANWVRLRRRRPHNL